MAQTVVPFSALESRIGRRFGIFLGVSALMRAALIHRKQISALFRNHDAFRDIGVTLPPAEDPQTRLGIFLTHTGLSVE